jgi:hypothetical protein
MAYLDVSSRRLLVLLLCFAYIFLDVRASHGSFHKGNSIIAPRNGHGTLFDRGLNVIDGNATTSANGTIAAARKVLAEAMVQQGIYNQWRFDHPRKNSYRPGQKVPLRRRDLGEPEAPHLNATVLAASALIAEHDAKAQAANGTLQKSYPPMSFKVDATDASPSSSGANGKRATENDWWVPAIQRDGSASMGTGPYPV